MRRGRGFMLILALLMLALLLVAGVGMMSEQKFRHSAVNSEKDSLQALSLSQSGLDDARVKLERDQRFPPSAANDQLNFSYSEDVFIGSERIGCYFVKVDRSHAQAPYYTFRLQSTGSVGPRNAPYAARSLRVELDVNPSSPNYWHWVNLQDDGSL